LENGNQLEAVTSGTNSIKRITNESVATAIELMDGGESPSQRANPPTEKSSGGRGKSSRIEGNLTNGRRNQQMERKGQSMAPDQRDTIDPAETVIGCDASDSTRDVFNNPSIGYHSIPHKTRINFNKICIDEELRKPSPPGGTCVESTDLKIARPFRKPNVMSENPICAESHRRIKRKPCAFQ
jgi:hypothetical protein